MELYNVLKKIYYLIGLYFDAVGYLYFKTYPRNSVNKKKPLTLYSNGII